MSHIVTKCKLWEGLVGKGRAGWKPVSTNTQVNKHRYWVALNTLVSQESTSLGQKKFTKPFFFIYGQEKVKAAWSQCFFIPTPFLTRKVTATLEALVIHIKFNGKWLLPTKLTCYNWSMYNEYWVIHFIK